MKLFYWSPFLSNIATVDAVINSINSIKRYDKVKKFETSIIDSVGEWEEKKNKLYGIDVIKLYQKSFYNLLPKGSFFKSRISQLIIFILSFNSLKNLLKKEKQKYLISHLIVSLPLVLFFLFKFETKLIIRISGTPKLNLLRKFLWSLFSKKVHIITCPTKSAMKKIEQLNIFPKHKLKLLYDPILNIKLINTQKKEKIDKKFIGVEYILGIGRLTKQKNFKLLLNSFKEILVKYPKLNLVILGEGEEKNNLTKQIKVLDLEKKVFLLGYKKNVFCYIENCDCYISSSFYEDPGFTLIEAGFLNKLVIAADSKTGPSEILDNSNNGLLYENNDKISLKHRYFTFKQMRISEINSKKISLKKYSKNFTFFTHFKKINQILSN